MADGKFWTLAAPETVPRVLERDYEFDPSQTGEVMRLFVAMTRQTWREWAMLAGND